MKAIIADDEPHLAQYLRDQLARLWPELQVAAIADSGPAALAAIAEHRPEIAFLDIRMPGATGLEVAAQSRGATRVVFVTAYDQYAVDAFERDAVDYLLKPVTEERLARTVSKLKQAQSPAPCVEAGMYAGNPSWISGSTSLVIVSPCTSRTASSIICV